MREEINETKLGDTRTASHLVRRCGVGIKSLANQVGSEKDLVTIKIKFAPFNVCEGPGRIQLTITRNYLNTP